MSNIDTGRIVTAGMKAAAGAARRRAAVRAAVEAHLAAVAAGRGYGSAERLISYAMSGQAAWQAEARAFARWRDRVWETGFEMQARDPEAPPQSVLAALPEIGWPAPGAEE